MNVVSKTGPMISACQSQSLPLLSALFDEIHIPSGVMAELAHHGWSDSLAKFSNLRVMSLTIEEQESAQTVTRQITEQSRRPSSEQIHLGEAEAILLAQRTTPKYDAVLLDELAARTVAKSHGLTVIGFGGVLLLAVDRGMMSPDELRDRLEHCRQLGTHYGPSLVQSLFDQATKLRSTP